MRSLSRPVRVERARPLLGTIVRIRCVGLPYHEANSLIEKAFGEIARIHRLMSFHDQASDVSRMNDMAAHEPVRISPDTFEVIRQALAFSHASMGLFDISVADQLVATRLLPAPSSRHPPSPMTSWRDIELIEPDHVRFRRAVWIDLGGIAKGYAVDRAMEYLIGDARIDWCINAGGDIRVSGPSTEQIVLRNMAAPDDPVPMVHLQDGALASSGGMNDGIASARAHIHGQTRVPIPPGKFVSVVAPQCLIADALTKVVLIQPKESHKILKAYGATAFVHEPGTGWTMSGAMA